jgi:energy-coupling factor transporter ATP-binding protein EcfA2
MLTFYVYRRPKPTKVKYPAVFLFSDGWDDYGYKTLFDARIKLSPEEDEIEIGSVKILETSKDRRPVHIPKVDDHFTSLATSFCSLGQSVSYYRHLQKLPKKIRSSYLKGLRDIISRPARRKFFESYEGFDTSLLRASGARDALRSGGYYIGYPTEEATPPKFMFVMQLPDAKGQHQIEFDFVPHDGLPHRINLLIGRNGTGKTQMLAHLAQTLYGGGEIERASGSLQGEARIKGDLPDFSKIIAISYSAFDQFPIPKKRPRVSRKTLFSYKYCGLRNTTGAVDVGELRTMLDEAMDAVAAEDRTDILRSLVDRLLGTSTAADFVSDKPYRSKLFNRLSAGQRFIVAIAADVVGFIERRSVLLFDEPETHLHPGLLSTLIAILEEILQEFQSFAIVATHSPILLQQVPRRYVRLMKRQGSFTSIGLPPLETFGEDVGELTRRVFELTEPERDFHVVIDRLIAKGYSADAIRLMFDRELPLPVQIYLDSVLSDDE